MSYDESEVAKKAKNIRYKKGALSLIQRDRLSDVISELLEECSYLLYKEDESVLVDALDGDEEELHEIKLDLAVLEGDCERLEEHLRDSDVTEYFDDYLVGSLGNTQSVVGYDQYETDYFNLCDFEAELAQRESGKRLMRLTKEQLIAIGGQCFGILISYLDLRHRFDCLTAVFGLIKDERKKLMDKISTVTVAYEEWAACEFSSERRKAERRLDNAISLLPDKVWAI